MVQLSNVCLFEAHECDYLICIFIVLCVVSTNQEIEHLKRDKNELEDRIGGFQERIANQESELEVPCSHRIELFCLGYGSLSGDGIFYINSFFSLLNQSISFSHLTYWCIDVAVFCNSNRVSLSLTFLPSVALTMSKVLCSSVTLIIVI